MYEVYLERTAERDLKRLTPGDVLSSPEFSSPTYPAPSRAWVACLRKHIYDVGLVKVQVLLDRFTHFVPKLRVFQVTQ